MASGGLWMLLALAVLVLASGLPVWALLLGVSSLSAAAGLALGAFDFAVLGNAGARVINLLEHDLLQALPLYVFVGLLLQRLPLAGALFGCAGRLFQRTGAAPSLSALGIGALVAPMNGSVASSSSLLSRIIVPRLGRLAPEKGIALVSVAATIGVVVPPSLVLILLGDAMLRAHTEATNLAPATLGAQRIVNAQDILHAALLPAVALLVLWAAVAWWQGRGTGNDADRVTKRDAAMATLTAAAIFGLLSSVFVGWMFAVEAAATGACLLVVVALASRWLSMAQWGELLHETIALAGALFALLVGATTFSLVFRLFGTDRWLADAVLGLQMPPAAAAVAVLACVAACALVLDAFEMIFVIVPIVAPLLVVRLGDAQQVAVLLLLVLQLGFLVPPLGYAVLMARTRSGLPPVRTPALLRALSPFVAAQLVVVAAVLAQPAWIHHLDAPAPPPGEAPKIDDDDITRQMREMAPAPEPDASSAR